MQLRFTGEHPYRWTVIKMRLNKTLVNNLFNNIKDYLIILVPLISIMFLFGYFTIPIQDSLGYGFGVYKLNLI